jgi:hypothetical protein
MTKTIALCLIGILLTTYAHASPASFPSGLHVRERCTSAHGCGLHALYHGAKLVTRAETTWPSARKSEDGWTCAGRERVTTRVLVASRGDAIGGGPPVCVPVAAFAR